MRSLFKPSTITSGIWSLCAISTAIIGISMAIQYWHLTTTSMITASITQTEDQEREWRELGEDLLDAETGQRGYILTRDDSYLKPYREGVSRIVQHLSNLRRLDSEPRSKEKIAQAEQVINAKLAELAETIGLTRQGNRDEALAIVKSNRGKQLMDDFRRLRAESLEIEARSLKEKRDEFLSEINKALPVTIFGGLSAIAVLLLIASSTSARLKRPTVNLLDGIQAMSSGDLNKRISVTSNDEIGRIAAAFNDMADHLQEIRKERELTMAELQRSNAELDSFAYVASHDLKAPLRGIRNLTEWISEDLGESASEDTRENLDLLSNRVDRLDSLLESLLEYSRVGRGNGSIEQVETEKLIEEIIQYISPREGFSIEVDGEMPVLMTYKAPLEKVIRNLINNALKHHDGNTGKVTVSSTDLGNFVEFSVTDDGPGIPVQFQEKIFQMFQTLKPRDEVEGSGMGLAIVKKTVESVGGYVRVESYPPQRGSKFIFSWPKHQ